MKTNFGVSLSHAAGESSFNLPVGLCLFGWEISHIPGPKMQF